jgi:DMSO/TMAO reductase YedYZ heme-binding membrane subunit
MKLFSFSTMRELGFYIKTGIFGLIIFATCYAYLRWMNIPGEMNKSAADTAVILMGSSMILSSICYFWNFLDWAIVYRKYLGLIGFAFGLTHLFLSWNVFLSLFSQSTWEKGAMWPALAGAVALGIFAIMALISNAFAARHLGGKIWRYILRAGYLAIIFVWFHVVLLKSARWITWYQGGMKTPPSLSLIVAIFMLIVLLMRLLLWWRLSRVAAKK